MKADLERRVHELLDAGRDPAEDPQVRSAVADDGEARAEVAALSTLEGWLRDWEVSVPEEDLEPIAQRIEQRLDEPIGSFDATAVPTFEDPDAKVRSLGGDRGAVRSGEYSLDALAGAVEAPAPAQMTGPSPAVSLSTPPRPERKRGPIAPWIAAAAVVALGVTVSVASIQRADEPPPTVSEAAPEPQRLPAAPAARSPGSGAGAMDDEAEEAEAPAPMEEERATGAASDVATAEEADESPPPAATATTEGMGRVGGTPTRRRSTAMAASQAQRAAPLVDDLAGSAGGATAGDEAVDRSRAGVRSCVGAGSDSVVVMVRFRDGAVRDARVVRPSANDATNQCVAAALRRARIRPQGDQARRTLYYRWRSPPAN